MKCPFCQHDETQVLDTRVSEDGAIRRRRRCASCDKRFTTYERVEHTLPVIVKKDGQRQPFMRERVLRSLELACRKRPVTPETLDEVAQDIELELAALGEKEISSRLVGERVMDRLKALDEVAYVRFASVYKSFRDIDEFMNEVGNLVRARPGD